MDPTENISLLKSQAHSSQQTSFNPIELKAQFKQKESIIIDYTKRIEQKREQMKQLSKTVNVLIERQLKKPIKQRPSFKTTYPSPKLNALRDQKNKIFAEIETLKHEIKNIKTNHPQSIVNEILANEAKIMQLENQITKIEDYKSIISKNLQENKGKIDQMKDNACLIDLQKKQIELNSLKKQCKQLEKQINIFSAQEMQKSSFFFEIKDRFDKEIIEEKIQVHVDQKQLKQLLNEIDEIYEKRKVVQTQGSHRIKNQQKTISELEKSIAEKKVQIREFQNDVLRAGLTSKRTYSMINLRGENSARRPKNQDNKPSEKKKLVNPEQKIKQKRIINKIYMIQKDDANCIYIGQWFNDTKPMSDKPQIALNSVQRIKSLVFYLSNGAVIGVKSSYLDKNGAIINGKELKLNDSVEIKVQINLEEVSQLEYSTKSGQFYIRFVLGNGSWKELGQRGSEVQKINLEPYYVKFAQILPNDSNSFVSALKLSLEEKIPQKLGLSDVAERTSSQMSYSNFESSVKKKVVLKGRSLKKIKEEPIIDHRLMLNKHK